MPTISQIIDRLEELESRAVPEEMPDLVDATSVSGPTIQFAVHVLEAMRVIRAIIRRMPDKSILHSPIHDDEL
jgi:hypothetical protein